MLFDLKKDNLFSEYEGYTKGNMFTELYKPYKNYVPQNLNFDNENVRLMMYEFVINELKLYLCIYPSNNEYQEKLRKYQKEYKDLKTRKDNYTNYFNPWEGIYV